MSQTLLQRSAFHPQPFTSCSQQRSRRRLRVLAGETRSANRTQWAQPSGLAATPAADRQQQAASTSDSVDALIADAAASLQPEFDRIDRRVVSNIRKLQKAFKANRVGPHHFAGSTGYGHGDLGRETLDKVMAEVMGAEAGLMRIHFFSGTHAIASALYATLRPGDEMLAVAGHPYDTLEEVIGLRGTPGHGSLMEWGVTYRELSLAPAGHVDWDALATAIVPGKTKVAHIQRSCGYSLRPTLSIADIRRAVGIIKSQDPNCLVLVDNCYGEFTEEEEPCDAGADLAMGSLIKNPGGTIAPGGGYVVGRADLVEAVGARLAAPGISTDAGQVSGDVLRILFQGLYLAPQVVGEAIKGGRLVAEVLTREGFEVVPASGYEGAPSMITAVKLGSREQMIAFCRAVQACSPVGSYVSPEPGVTAGYGDEVIFADGTFIDGSTAELSADGPIRPPYVVYCQGGTHLSCWKVVLASVLPAVRAAVAKDQ